MKSGVVVLDDRIELPEGTEVKVELVASPALGNSEQPIPTLYERLRWVAGAAVGLPQDLSVNHDHYLYGVPKRE